MHAMMLNIGFSILPLAVAMISMRRREGCNVEGYALAHSKDDINLVEGL